MVRTASSSQADPVAARTTAEGVRTSAPPRTARRSHHHATPPAVAARARATANHGPASDHSTVPPAAAPSPASVTRSATRRVTVEAVAGPTPIPARRTTLTTRSGSPRRMGRTWLAP